MGGGEEGKVPCQDLGVGASRQSDGMLNHSLHGCETISGVFSSLRMFLQVLLQPTFDQGLRGTNPKADTQRGESGGLSPI